MVAGSSPDFKDFLGSLLAISESETSVDVLARALEAAQRVTNASSGGAMVIDSGNLIGAVATGIDEDVVYKLMNETAEWDSQPILTNSLSELTARFELGEGHRALIHLSSQGRGDFDEDDEWLIETVSAHARNSLRVLRLEQDRVNEALWARIGSYSQHFSDVVTLLDKDGIIRFTSPAIRRVLGYGNEELVGTDALEVVFPDERPMVRSVITKAVKEPGATTFEARLSHREGHFIHTETSVVNLLRDPEVRGILLSTRDVSDRKALEEELTYAALHDSVTDLPNRGLFRDRVQHALARAERHDHPVGVLFIDLDDFKKFNELEGHAIGDQLLAAVAERLRDNLRGPDTAARIGGDEFALLLEDIRKAEDAQLVAERIRESLAEPFDLGDREVVSPSSIGVAVGSPRSHSADDLIRDADVAMYAAKARGKAMTALFEPSMHESLLERIGLETDLRRAASNEEFVVYYQPTIVTSSGEIAGAEALVRWLHPHRGLVSPAEFIPLAEETGLIVSIGAWVLNEACRQAKAWQQQFPDRSFTMSVNLSARQLQTENLLDEVTNALAKSGLGADSLILEITESVLLQDTDAVIETLEELKTLGVRIAVDDFGTGYSSLSYLQNLPVDILKIDRSFVSGLIAGSQELAVTRAIVELGQALELKTVAEGIELAEQLLHLRSMHCDLCQGFYFARPLDGEAMEALLTRSIHDQTWSAVPDLSLEDQEVPPVVSA